MRICPSRVLSLMILGLGIAGCSQDSADDSARFAAGPNKVVLQVEPML
jgi:hypothetical protein